MKRKNIIFNNVLIAKNKIRNIEIEPYTEHSLPLPRLKIIIKFDNGDKTVCKVKIATEDDIKNKFGTYTKTYWHTEKGLNYDMAELAFENNSYSQVLIAIQNILNDKEASANGDILMQLFDRGVFDTYKEKYLSLIRETTDEEYEEIQDRYNLAVLSDKLTNPNLDENEKEELYEKIKVLYTKLYKTIAPSIDEIIRNVEEEKRMAEFIGREYD